MKRWLQAFVVAMQTLTRLPTPSLAGPPDADLLARSAVYFPLIGALIGAAGWGVYQAAATVWPPAIAAGLTLAAWTLLTGALHEDGLADVADAFGSQRSRDKILAVMKDSRIGVYGALALVLATLLRWSAIAALEPAAVGAALVGSQAIPRVGIVLTAQIAGPATTGTGGAFARGLGVGHFLAAACIAALTLALLGRETPVWSVAPAAAIAVLSAIYFRVKLDGVTGDCLGASAIVQEIAVLLTFLAL